MGPIATEFFNILKPNKTGEVVFMNIQVPDASALIPATTADLSGTLSGLLSGLQGVADKQVAYHLMSDMAERFLGMVPPLLWLALCILTTLLPVALLLRSLRYLGRSSGRSLLQLLLALLSGLVALVMLKGLPASVTPSQVEIGIWAALVLGVLLGLAVPLWGPKPKAKPADEPARREPKLSGGKGAPMSD
jgi:hypothetical protein